MLGAFSLILMVIFSIIGSGIREAELMASLKLLIDRLNTGNIPLSKETWEKLQHGAPDNGIHSTKKVYHVSGGDLVGVNFYSCRYGVWSEGEGRWSNYHPLDQVESL